MMRNKTVFIISCLLSAGMFVLWFTMLAGTDAPRVWRGFLINYLFFTSLAGGMVVWPAIIIASHGDWMHPVEFISRTGFAFSVPSVIALIALWAGSPAWAPWIHASADKQWWLNNTFLFSRNLVALIVFWLVAFWFSRNRSGKKRRVAAGWLVFIYAITFSLTGFDFVMALEPEWDSMMTGGYFFISALYLAVAAWTFLSLLLGSAEAKVLHDLGKLIVAFCMLTAYLMFCHLLPIWYENMPEETIFLLPRMNLAWKKVSYALLILIYIGPLLLLLPAWTKQNRLYLASISFMVMVGMWIERWWLVSAVFEPNRILFGWGEVVPALAFLGLMTAGITYSLKRQTDFIQQ